MQHRTRVLSTSSGYVGVCSCGFTTNDFGTNAAAAQNINDHEVTAMRGGVKVTHLTDPAQLELPTKKK